MLVECLSRSRYAETAAMFARAFSKDPIWCYLFPHVETRAADMAWMFERWTRAVASLGAGYVTPGGEGAALWIPPGYGPGVGLWPLLRAGLVWTPFRLGLGWLRRAWPVFLDAEHRQKIEVRGPHWQLDTLGVDPACQRRGVGTVLIEHVLGRADEERIPCYVVTNNPANVAYYQRNGFRVVKENTVNGTGCYVCSLRRPVP